MTKMIPKVRPSRATLVSTLQIKLNNGNLPQRKVFENYDTKDLIVLPQMRQSFEEEGLESLATQLAFVQLHPLTIRRCSEREFKKHLALANLLFPNFCFKLNYYKNKKRNDGTYDVLIAGERRFRASEKIQNWNRKLFAAVYTNLTSECSFFLQQVENTAKIPEREEESYMVGRLYRILHDKKHLPTHVELASLINRSPAYTGDLIRFHGLPEYIKDYYNQGGLNYSMAIQFGRLEKVYEKERIEREIIHAIISRMDTTKVRRYVQSLLEEKSNPGLFGSDFELEMQNLMLKKRKETVAQQILHTIANNRRYIEVLDRLLKNNLISLDPQDGKPYANGSPQSQLLNFVKDFHIIIPQVRALFSSPKFEKLEAGDQSVIEQIVPLQFDFIKSEI